MDSSNNTTPEESSPQPDTNWQFSDDDSSYEDNSLVQVQNDTQPVSWTASEFIAHAKTGGWYLLLCVGGIALAALTLLFTQDKFATGLVLVASFIFIALSARKPRELQYTIDDGGLRIDEKSYPYSSFRSFAVVREEGVESIWFMPLKRFNPGLTIYFAPDDGEKIVSVLAQFLPVENKKLDPIDKLMHKLRF